MPTSSKYRVMTIPIPAVPASTSHATSNPSGDVPVVAWSSLASPSDGDGPVAGTRAVSSLPSSSSVPAATTARNCPSPVPGAAWLRSSKCVLPSPARLVMAMPFVHGEQLVSSRRRGSNNRSQQVRIRTTQHGHMRPQTLHAVALGSSTMHNAAPTTPATTADGSMTPSPSVPSPAIALKGLIQNVLSTNASTTRITPRGCDPASNEPTSRDGIRGYTRHVTHLS